MPGASLTACEPRSYASFAAVFLDFDDAVFDIDVDLISDDDDGVDESNHANSAAAPLPPTPAPSYSRSTELSAVMPKQEPNAVPNPDSDIKVLSVASSMQVSITGNLVFLCWTIGPSAHCLRFAFHADH